jgi:hypothetical protein
MTANQFRDYRSELKNSPNGEPKSKRNIPSAFLYNLRSFVFIRGSPTASFRVIAYPNDPVS